MKRLLAAVAAASSALAWAGPVTARPISVQDLLTIPRVSDPRISSDGTRVVYTVSTPDVKNNRTDSNIWMVATDGSAPRQLTTAGKDGGARWSPDGKRIAFVSSRGGSDQLYVMNAGGGEAARLTDLSGGVDEIVWAPDGNAIAFVSEVYPDCEDEACNVARDKQTAARIGHARIYETLLYRHWTTWLDGKRSHLFIVAVDGTTAGQPRDLTPAADYDVPPRQRGGARPIAFAPDGAHLAFTAVADRVEAASTNGDLFEVSVSGGATKRLTDNPGFDGNPAYSPDGKLIAYHSQARGGYESDLWRIRVLDRATGTSRRVTDFDRSADTILWNAKGDALYFNAEDRGEMPIFSVPLKGGEPTAMAAGTFNSEFDVAPTGTIVAARVSLAHPTELVAFDAGAPAVRELTHQAREAMAGIETAAPESFTFASADGAQVQGFLLKPPAFDPSKKYPVMMLLHGGPQTMWGDSWSYRWNAQAFAAPGYVVVMINRRGSTGFGQAFTDAITNDWGGKAFDDLMTGLDYVLATYKYTDGARVGAAGASYGGFMIDWMASHAKGRFTVLVSHAGVYDNASMYGATEELWFPEHDLGGLPWTNRAEYEKWSPSTYAAEFGKYKTPTLVVCGERDFRVPYTQSLQFYTALQRQGVPSKLIVFPEEGHWVLKPQDSVLWYDEVLGWLGKYLQSGRATSQH